jgi:HEAT repeat protein
MSDTRMPHQIIGDLAAAYRRGSDAEVLGHLAALPPLADEDDPCWTNEEYWRQVADRYLALADVAAARRLRPAVALLLDRACYGDPGEIMRGLRHRLEAIVNPNWSELADMCLEAARSRRPGTRLWAIAQLTVLEDPRAKPIFEEAIRSGPDDIRWHAEIGLERLATAPDG